MSTVPVHSSPILRIAGVALAVEFLLVLEQGHAKYRTSRDRQGRASSCPHTLAGGIST